MTDTVDPRRIALRAEISPRVGRAEAPGIDATEAQSRIAAAATLTAVLAGSEPDHFTTTILAAADTDSDRTVAAHLREVAANLPTTRPVPLPAGQLHTNQTGARS